MKATGTNIALQRYQSRVGSGSRIITATVVTGAGAYAPGFIIGDVLEGANVGNYLNLVLNGGEAKLVKEVKGTRTELAKGGSVAASKTYKITILVTCPTVFGAPTKIQVWVGSTEAINYSLVPADQEAMVDTNETELQDGFRQKEDSESKYTRFRVVPV